MSIIFILFTLFSAVHGGGSGEIRRRRLLHHPLVIVTTPPPVQAPSPSPQQQPTHTQIPKYPFNSTPPNTTPSQQTPFFRSDPADPPSLPSLIPPPPPPPPFPVSSIPANISSLSIPHTSSPSLTTRRHILFLSLSLSLLFAAVIVSIIALSIYFRRRRDVGIDEKATVSDSQRLFPPNVPPSDGKPTTSSSTNAVPLRGVSSSSTTPPTTSSEFLYLGTLVSSRSSEQIAPRGNTNIGVRIGVSSSPTGYHKLGSPELKPLPPLPKSCFTSGEMCFSKEETKFETTDDDDDEEEEGEEEFFSPRGSSERKDFANLNPDPNPGPTRVGSSSRRENNGSISFNSRTASYPYTHSNSPSNSITSSCESPVVNLSPKSSSSTSTVLSRSDSDKVSGLRNLKKLPQPPPPLPPPRFWEAQQVVESDLGFPELVPPSRPGLSVKNESEETTLKPKLKPLHWDKVRASSDRAMVWDQLKSSSFQLNEEMIETLFMINNSNLNSKDNKARRQIVSSLNQENQVLDPKKSQNIAILLRALNVTIDEVCEALLEGNSDTLGTELLESLLKMAPTKEEERKIKEFKDESPFKLGPAEKFLKAVLDIPFAFKRVDAMLYIANFDSEVEYLKRSFETLEAACEELKNSRMFLKLLEAVLKTGNRMNDGTNRGDAQAFKLDTLLKLVDVKGADGKTTLLHFVVQEIIRAEGSRLSGENQNLKADKTEQSDLQDDVEFRKLGLQVVSGLSGELTSVKKAAAMDSDVLSNDVAKLTAGVDKIIEVMKLNETATQDSSRRFSESMHSFLKKAEPEIITIQAIESGALSRVKGITVYFHGNSAKEEAHPFRIFIVVKDFLSILDQVCKDVGKINERTIYSSVRPMPVNPTTLPPAFPAFIDSHHASSSSSSDVETSSSL